MSYQLIKHLPILLRPWNLHMNLNTFNIARQYSKCQVLVPLKHRKLLKVSGSDATNFLQGLITNDMRHFDDGSVKSMYAMFLNSKSRVLYDTLIYKWDNGNNYLVECDESVLRSLQNHLKLYKLKQAVNVENVNENLNLWALMSSMNNQRQPSNNIDAWNSINIFKDPRLAELGFRLLTVSSMSANDIIKEVGKDADIKIGDVDNYRYLRYSLGVGEGADEMPPGLCFPLEVNCDYLHGVSFHKGCYIGQELTARVYHTGVVRKRLMPIKFYMEINDVIEKDTVIKSDKDPKSNLGKLKGHVLDCGLGLVRIKEALEARSLVVGDNICEVVKPSWWPIEAPKEKLGTKLE